MNPEAWRHPRIYCCRKCGKQWAAPPLRQPEYGCPDPECGGALGIIGRGKGRG